MRKAIIILTMTLFGGIVVVLMIFSFIYFRGIKQIDEHSTVYVKKTDGGFQLYRNGEPFYIRGASGNAHFKELANIGGNTIRVYDTINIQNILDEAHKYNLAVIVDIPLPVNRISFKFYSNQNRNKVLMRNIEMLVEKYKNHPSLLMWNLGNEISIPLMLRKGDSNFITTFNNLINIIHKNDPNHPVSTAIYGKNQLLGIRFYFPKLDIVGINVFGDLENLQSKIDKFSKWTGIMPFYISEWGNNGPWEEEVTLWDAPIEPTSTKKGEQFKNRYRDFIGSNKQCLGSLAFYWGQKLEKTTTWFSIFDEQGRKSQVYYDLQKTWNEKIDSTCFPPQIKYMLVNNKGARDQLIFEPNIIEKAKILFEGKVDSTYKFVWKIYGESWSSGDKVPLVNFSGCFENEKGAEVFFRVPSKEGPYRIFVYVYDKNGYFATTNTPFYVLNPK